MLETLVALVPLFVVSLVVFGLLFFRREVRTLVNWIAGFRRIEKTAEGYAIQGASEPGALIGTVIHQEGKAVAATREELGHIIESNTDSVEPDWLDALMMHDYAAARAIIEGELERTSDKNERIRLKSFIAHVEFEKSQASGIEEFERLISDHPVSFLPYMWYSLSYYWKGDYYSCLNIVNRGLTSADLKVALIEVKANCLRALGRYEEAIAAAESGIAEDSSEIKYYASIAETCRAQDHTELALEWYRRALRIDSANYPIQARLAEYLWELEQYEEALLHYVTLTQVEPNNASHFSYLGNVYVSLKMYGLALEAYERADQLADGSQAWIIGNIGNLYNNCGLYPAAITFLKKALEVDPDSKFAHKRLASAMEARESEYKKMQSVLKEARQEYTKRESEAGNADLPASLAEAPTL